MLVWFGNCDDFVICQDQASCHGKLNVSRKKISSVCNMVKRKEWATFDIPRNILGWLRSFRVKIADFLSFFCLSIPKRDLDAKVTQPNTEFVHKAFCMPHLILISQSDGLLCRCR